MLIEAIVACIAIVLITTLLYTTHIFGPASLFLGIVFGAIAVSSYVFGAGKGEVYFWVILVGVSLIAGFRSNQGL